VICAKCGSAMERGFLLSPVRLVGITHNRGDCETRRSCLTMHILVPERVPVGYTLVFAEPDWRRASRAASSPASIAFSASSATRSRPTVTTAATRPSCT
jgi:hypothetical protein